MLRPLLLTLSCCLVLAGCGGDADPPQPAGQTTIQPPPPTVVAPTVDPIGNQSVTAGQTATFTATATGTAPLSYQWSGNGAAIAGATGASYTTPATSVSDSGSTFTVTVSNSAGSVTSNSATLTVTAPLTFAITQQPQSVTVQAGASATFSAAASCSTNDLTWAWQRSADGTTFTAIAGATMDSYSFTTAASDNAAQFRAVATCDAQTLTTSAATLTVTTPAPPPATTASLALLPVMGLRDQANLGGLSGIDADAAGSFTITTSGRIMRVTKDLSTINVVAGAVQTGSSDGPAASATFNSPQAVVHDSAGNLYVADTGNFTIRRIGTDGTVSTIAGAVGSSMTTDGTGSAARFTTPAAMVMGADGALYVADPQADVIRRVTTAGVVTTYAGIAGSGGYTDGAPLTAQFNRPSALVSMPNGDLLVADSGNGRIRRIAAGSAGAAGTVDTFAGSGANTGIDADGVGTAAAISSPIAMALNDTTLAVREEIGELRLIDTGTKTVSTLIAANENSPDYGGGVDGAANRAQIAVNGGIAPIAGGGFMLADFDHALRTVTPSGTVTTFASNYAAGITDTGVGVLAQMPLGLNDSQGGSALAVDPSGNVLISARYGREVRRIDPTGVVTLAAGLPAGTQPGTLSSGAPIDGVGSDALFSVLGYSIAVDTHGVAFASDGSAIRRIGTDDSTSLFAGNVGTFGAVDGSGAAARFNTPAGLAFAPSGVLYVGDFGNSAIRRIDTAGNVTTYAGVLGDSGHVDGPIATARFVAPQAIAVAPDGSLYVADYGPSSITGGVLRKISSDGSTVSTYSFQGEVRVLTVGSDGTVYFGSDTGLYSLPPGANSPTLLIAGNGPNSTVVVGNAPQLSRIAGLAVLGPKKLVLQSAATLYVVTLP